MAAVVEKVREAQAGETVSWWGTDTVVAETCDSETGVWFCATHQDGFRGNWLVTSHSDDGKRHLLVWVCGAHGPEASGVAR